MRLLDLAYPYQRKFITNKAKRKIWVSSRQIGKSWSVAMILAFKALQRNNGLAICISVNSRSASEIISKCKQFAESVKVLSGNAITYTASFDTIRFSNGSRIMSLPSTADSLRGWSAQCVVVDEASFVWKLDDILQGLAPTLTRDPDAELILTTTPAGKNGPFYELYNNALNDPQWYVQHTTIHDAIEDGLNVDLNSLHSLCPDPDVFAREYECVFSKEFGSFIDPSIVDFIDDIPSGQGGYYLGMDIGRKHDRTALTILKAVKDKAYLENVITLSKCEYSQQIQVVKDLNSKYGFQAGFIDEGGIGSAVAEQICKTISSKLKGMQFTASNKTPMYEALRARIFDHTLLFKADFKDQIIQDFANVSRIVTEDGKVKFSAGRDASGHSDLTSSLTLALEAMRKSPMNFKSPQTHVPFSSFGNRQHIFSRL